MRRTSGQLTQSLQALRPWFDVAPLTLSLHLHGIVLTLWVVLFVVQVRLIAVGRRRLHMSHELKIRDAHIPVESALVLSALAYHWHTRRRVQWVLLVGGVLLIATQAARRFGGRSEVWTKIGNWLV